MPLLSVVDRPRSPGDAVRNPESGCDLGHLARMSGSLGGKGVLWELLASSPPTMKAHRPSLRGKSISHWATDPIAGHDRRVDGFVVARPIATRSRA